MIVLLLLGSSVCVCLSYGVRQEEYGATFKINLYMSSYTIEFKPKDHSALTVLWKRDDPSASGKDSRRQVTDFYYVIRNLTQRDSGQYMVRDKNLLLLSSWTLEVKEKRKVYTLKPGERLDFSSDLEPKSCNIYFFSKRDHEQTDVETEIVRQGRVQKRLDKLGCAKFYLLEPCGIVTEDLQMSCKGRFEVRDQNDDKALVVLLEMEQKHKDPFFTALGISAGVVALIGCCCVKCCCCGKSSSDKNDSEAPDSAVNLQENNNVPAGPGEDHPSQPLMPLYPVPSYTQTNPLLHNQSPMNAANAEVPAPADVAAVPNCTDYEPRFELKGMSFPMSLPLSSDSTYQDVYFSDKLNFK